MACCLLLMQGICIATARAQDYPVKPIRIVLPVPPGAGTDIVGRLVAERLQARWGQAALVEHRAGAGGNIAAEFVYKAPPDGYTLMMSGQGTLVINKTLYPKINYDPAQYVPVSLIATGVSVLVVHPRVPANSLRELIAYAKSNPGKLNYASSGSGTIPHLAAELLNTLAGIRMVHVPYKGMAPALTDVLAGQADLMFAGLISALSNTRDGKLRMLGVGSEKREAALPDIPAINELLPGFAAENWFGLVAPPGTPASIANRISVALSESFRQPDVAKRLTALSFEPVASTPAELATLMKAESERWARVIRATGAKPE